MSPVGDLFQLPITAALLGAVLLLLVVVCLTSGWLPQRGEEPPGPRPLPLLGNLLQLDLDRPYNTLCDLAKRYGSVFTVHLGPKKVVVLAGYRTVRQALVSHAEEFGNRQISPVFHDFCQGHGIIFSNGDSWKEMRRFALSTLRDFGMGKKSIQSKIIEECHHLIDEFEKHEGKAFDTTQAVTYAASNIISAIMYGDRFEYSDPVFRAMVVRDNETIHLTGSNAIQLYNAFPFLRPWLKTWRELMRNVEDNKEETKSLIVSLKESLNPEISRCFVDSFLFRKKSLEASGITDSHYHDENLVHSVMNLFAAGTDTMGNTIRWGLLLMAKYPYIQDQVQEELSRVIGSRQVVAEDRKNLPFTDAVIHETQRLANIVPMSIPHITSRDVTFQGYFIKKGTTIFPLLSSVLCDETEWEQPNTFNPAHFLDKEGRRVCLGESLARMELFLFFTSLLQRFRFRPPLGVTEEELDLTPYVGLTLAPKPHQLCAVSCP
ncbi:cytochrome P450 2K1-like [Lampris incognitus]|uniref:cytochrome P450 2K1-like n=1 Tax=Lampris incognitus TaxID=2546036 RepID=UPI0024B55BEF|nr:cytochrome P450 2K1-like [Lampris incognitus]